MIKVCGSKPSRTIAVLSRRKERAPREDESDEQRESGALQA